MRRGAQGFTLIELMIALGILAVGLLGLIGLTTTAMSANKVARQFTEGLNLARDKVESLKRNNLYTINPNLTVASVTVVTGTNVCTDSSYRCYHEDLENSDGEGDNNDDLDTVSVGALGAYTVNGGPSGPCSLSSAPSDPTTSSATNQADHYTTETLSGETFHVMWNIQDSTPRADMKTVQVIVWWLDRCTERTVKQRTIIVAKDIRFY